MFCRIRINFINKLKSFVKRFYYCIHSSLKYLKREKTLKIVRSHFIVPASGRHLGPNGRHFAPTGLFTEHSVVEDRYRRPLGLFCHSPSPHLWLGSGLRGPERSLRPWEVKVCLQIIIRTRDKSRYIRIFYKSLLNINYCTS